MALNSTASGLRSVRIHHNANSAKRVEITVPALDELEVSPEVAAQLQAADPHFRAVEPETAGEPEAKPKARSKKG